MRLPCNLNASRISILSGSPACGASRNAFGLLRLVFYLCVYGGWSGQPRNAAKGSAAVRHRKYLTNREKALGIEFIMVPPADSARRLRFLNAPWKAIR